MNRLILFPKETSTFRSRVPVNGDVKFLFRSSHPVTIVICESSEDPNVAKKKYVFKNYLCINNSLTIPKEWKNIAAHVTNSFGTEKAMCEYAFKFNKKD